jgi:cephalosporin-C deacetylase-like acetyl esterase
MKIFLPVSLLVLSAVVSLAQDSLPPLREGQVPRNLAEFWGEYDPRREPVAAEVTREWEQDGIVCRVLRYHVGVFKGAPAKVAAFYAFPKGAAKLPGLLHLHGGGQSASFDSVLTDAKKGYASMSLNWGCNVMRMGKDGVYEGPNTDWGKVDATHPPQRNKVNHFAGGIAPDEFTLDPVESPRNSSWMLVVVAARRALTFLEQQPEVDPDRLGVYGHSMGGRLTTHVTGIDKRVKAAVPSCGGSGDLLEGQTDVLGGRRQKISALELGSVSENPYIEQISVPTLWLSPTNDFHAHMDNMAYTWRNVPEGLLRLSVSPHFNHRHSSEHAITQHLWFEAHLKGALQLPATPQLALNLKTQDGVPELVVRPDSSRPVKAVHLYYSTDPHALTRFWRDAHAVQSGVRWTAPAPVLDTGEPLFAFANVQYDTPEPYRNLPQAPGGSNSDVFTLSSREVYATAEQLQAAGVKATGRVERMIDDGARGWHDWYRLNWGNPSLWTAVTRKVKDAKWRGPDGAKLVFEVNPLRDASLVVSVTCNEWGAFSSGPKLQYHVVKELKGSPEFQTVSVSLEELVPTDPQNKVPLANWQTLTELALCPSLSASKSGQPAPPQGKPWAKPTETQVRNLHWEGGEYKTAQVKGAALSEAEHHKTFNEAIRKSLEQEKLDRK